MPGRDYSRDGRAVNRRADGAPDLAAQVEAGTLEIGAAEWPLIERQDAAALASPGCGRNWNARDPDRAAVAQAVSPSYIQRSESHLLRRVAT